MDKIKIIRPYKYDKTERFTLMVSAATDIVQRQILKMFRFQREYFLFSLSFFVAYKKGSKGHWVAEDKPVINVSMYRKSFKSEKCHICIKLSISLHPLLILKEFSFETHKKKFVIIRFRLHEGIEVIMSKRSISHFEVFKMFIYQFSFVWRRNFFLFFERK